MSFKKDGIFQKGAKGGRCYKYRLPLFTACFDCPTGKKINKIHILQVLPTSRKEGESAHNRQGKEDKCVVSLNKQYHAA